MSELIQVTTTIDDSEKVDAIAEALIEQKLAACVQVLGPVLSIYRWDGEIEEAEEWQIVIKTSQARFKDVEKRIKDLHDYDTPEIIAVPIVGGSKEYLSWLEDSVKG